MGLIRQLLPYLLVLFFFWKGNRQLLFLLGIPFLMFMSTSIFFENAKPFHVPGRYYGDQLQSLWLLLLWIISRIFSKNTFGKEIRNSRLNATDYCIIGLIIISVIGLARVYNGYYPYTTDIFDRFWIITTLFFAYFIIKDWISRNEPETVVKFLYAIVIVNSIAATLYILHQGLHFNIYTSVEYFSDSFQGQEITRTFWFMPHFLFFSIVFLLVFTKKYSIVSIGLLLVNLLAVVISYTISYVAVAILILVLYFILTGLKEGRLASAFKNLIVYALMGMLGVFIMSKLLPANTNYLLSRIHEQTKSQHTLREPNDLEIRFINTADMISKIDRDKKLLGMGPVTKLQAPKIVEMQATTADMAWAGVILHWGFIGLALFFLIYIFSFFQAFRFFLKSDGIISDLALMLLLYIIAQFIESWVSWTFLSGHGFTIGLWYFAVLSALSVLNKTNKLVAGKGSCAPTNLK